MSMNGKAKLPRTSLIVLIEKTAKAACKAAAHPGDKDPVFEANRG